MLFSDEQKILFEGSKKGFVNRITATGAYMLHRFLRASFKLNNFSIFCPFATFDSSKCS